MNKDILELINVSNLSEIDLKNVGVNVIKKIDSWYGITQNSSSEMNTLRKIQFLSKCYSLRNIDLYSNEMREENLLKMEKEFNVTRKELVHFILNSIELLENSKLTTTKYIAIEGVDGSGKTVQLKLLEAYLEKIGIVKSLDFPVYDGFFGKEIGKLLSSTHEETALTVSPKNMSLWYALDRYKTMKNIESKKYDYILLNRYTLSSIVYQSIRSNNDHDLEQWIYDLEHKELNLPIPNLYIIFNIPLDLSKKNIQKKNPRSYTNEALDIYESSTEIQQKAQIKYTELANLYENIEVIDVVDLDNNLKDMNTIHEEVVKILKKYELC